MLNPWYPRAQCMQPCALQFDTAAQDAEGLQRYLQQAQQDAAAAEQRALERADQGARSRALPPRYVIHTRRASRKSSNCSSAG